jgi:tetratricopeptide (TPR) repeat protein
VVENLSFSEEVNRGIQVEGDVRNRILITGGIKVAGNLTIILNTLPQVKDNELRDKIESEKGLAPEKAEKAEALALSGNKALKRGKKYLENKEFERAARKFKEALRYLPKSSEAAGDVYINLASAYAYLYQWDMALDAYTKAEKIGKELNRKPLLALAYGGTGTIYHSISKYDQAIEHFEKSLEINREVGNRRGEGVTLNNIGSIYKAWGKYDQAIEYYKQSLAIFRDVKDKKSEGVTLNNIGMIYDSWGKYDQAIEYYKQSLEITREVGDRQGEGVTLFNIAKIYEKQGRIQEAVDNLEEVVRIDEATKNPRLTQDRAYLEKLKDTLRKQASQ